MSKKTSSSFLDVSKNIDIFIDIRLIELSHK
jgi:hypothetical protein